MKYLLITLLLITTSVKADEVRIFTGSNTGITLSSGFKNMQIEFTAATNSRLGIAAKIKYKNIWFGISKQTYKITQSDYEHNWDETTITHSPTVPMLFIEYQHNSYFIRFTHMPSYSVPTTFREIKRLPNKLKLVNIKTVNTTKSDNYVWIGRIWEF